MLMLLSVEVILILMMMMVMMMIVMVLVLVVLVVVVAVMTVMDACGDKTGHLWEIQKLFKNLMFHPSTETSLWVVLPLRHGFFWSFKVTVMTRSMDQELDHDNPDCWVARK